MNRWICWRLGCDRRVQRAALLNHDAAMGLACACELIIDGSVADGVGHVGSAACVTPLSDSSSTSPAVVQQQYDIRQCASGGTGMRMMAIGVGAVVAGSGDEDMGPCFFLQELLWLL